MDVFIEKVDGRRRCSTKCAAIVDPLVEKNGNKLVIDCADRHRHACDTDLTKLKQSLLNLLSNAGKFTKNGTVTLAVIAPSTTARAMQSISR